MVTTTGIRWALREEPPLHIVELQGHEPVTAAVIAAFEREFGGPHMHQTHLELGRHENTWIDREAIPEAEPLLEAIRTMAGRILRRDDLRMAFWFNVMQPGERTNRHNHEEGDELLSGVYYLETPPRSGDLLLYLREGTRRIPPMAGRAIFFPPRLAHAVEPNRSDRRRLSLAFNLGPAELP